MAMGPTEIPWAIANCRLIEFVYVYYSTVVEPYVYGTGHSGRELLFAYQLGSVDSTAPSTGWMAFEVKKISGLRILRDRSFTPRDGAESGDGLFSAVHLRL